VQRSIDVPAPSRHNGADRPLPRVQAAHYEVTVQFRYSEAAAKVVRPLLYDDSKDIMVEPAPTRSS